MPCTCHFSPCLRFTTWKRRRKTLMFFKSLVSSDLPGQDGKFEYPRASPEYETSCFLAGKPQLNPEQLLICMRIIKGSCHHSSFTPVAESPVWPPRVSPLSVHTFCSHSKRWSLFSFPLTLVWPCDLLCSTERGREDILGLLSLVLRVWRAQPPAS